MNELFVALGLVLVIEGLFYSAFPGSMRNMVEEMAKLPDQTLRNFGFVAVSIGVFIVWMVKG